MKFIFYSGGLLLFFIISCSKQVDSVKEIMDKVENTVDQYPDSALNRLNSIFYPEDLSKSQFNKYNLLLVRAKDKCVKDITGDTVIFAVKDYYIRQKDDRNAAYAAFYCARVLHEQKKEEEEVFKAYLTAIDWADKIRDYNLMGLAQGNLGIFYREHYLHEKAITANKAAADMYRKAGNYKNEISALILIGICFVEEHKTDSAFQYYDESIKLADQYRLANLQSFVRQNKGVAYREKKDYNQAKQLFREALSYAPDSMDQARILMNMAKVYISENKSDSTKYYLNQALKISFQDPALLRTSYLLLSQTEERDGHYRQALDYYKEYYSYTLKVFNSEKNNRLMELQHQYDFEKLKNEERSVIIKQQKVLLTLFIVLLAACFISLIFYRRSIRNRNLLLEAEYKIIALQKMAKEYTEEKQSLKSIILQYFDVLRKSASLEKYITEDERKTGQGFHKKFNKIVYGQDRMDWDKLFQVMNQYHDGFYEKVREMYPELKDAEFRICCLSCETGFDDMEIAIITEKSVGMVRKIRSVIRKKLAMTAYDHDFYSFLSQKLSKK